MSRPGTVALLGPTQAPEIASVAAHLERLGVGVRDWNSDRWPGDLPITIEVSPSGERWALEGELDDLAAVYVQNVGLDPRRQKFEGPFERRPVSLYNQIREYRGLLYSLLRRLEREGVEVVNPVRTAPYHDWKPWQIAEFAAAGLPVPRTLATNDPDEARAFVERVGGAVFKPVAGGGYARPVSPETLEDQPLDRLANAPVQFQERLRGANLRAFVVDGAIAGAGRIRTDTLDYRREDHDVDRVNLVGPPADIARRAADVLGLPFAGIDLVETDDGPVLLEANPSPMFARFDELADTDVGLRLAEYLAP